MNKKIIGTFLKELRIKKGLSINEVAKELKIKVWKLKLIEKGKFILDDKILSRITNLYNISIFEIINGQFGNSKEDKDKATIALANEFEKEYNKRNKVYYIMIPIMIIIISVLLIYMYINRSFAYRLNGESKNFIYTNSIISYNSGMYLFSFGDIIIKNNNIDESNITYIRLMCNDRLIIGSSNFLSGITHEKKGYDELFPNEVINNLDDWYYEITYVFNNQEYTEIVEINNAKIS